jgi:hypothetical protein
LITYGKFIEAIVNAFDATIWMRMWIRSKDTFNMCSQVAISTMKHIILPYNRVAGKRLDIVEPCYRARREGISIGDVRLDVEHRCTIEQVGPADVNTQSLDPHKLNTCKPQIIRAVR